MENDSPELYSKVIRAGKRTYFFDVKATKGNDLFLTITESLKNENEGRPAFKKHKIFLYKEDFEKFIVGLTDAISEIDRLKESDPLYSEIEATQPEKLDLDDISSQ